MIHNASGFLPIDDAFAPRPLIGPYRSITDWCADRARRDGACGAVIASRDGATVIVDGDDTCALIVTAGDRVWADEGAVPCPPRAPPVVEELARHDLIGGLAPLLVLRVASVHGDLHERSMLACGAGASRAPRCTPWIPIDTVGDTAQVSYHPAIARDGTLTFRVEDREDTVDPDWIDTLSRPHPLRFP